MVRAMTSLPNRPHSVELIFTLPQTHLDLTNTFPTVRSTVSITQSSQICVYASLKNRPFSWIHYLAGVELVFPLPQQQLDPQNSLPILRNIVSTARSSQIRVYDTLKNRPFSSPPPSPVELIFRPPPPEFDPQTTFPTLRNASCTARSSQIRAYACLKTRLFSCPPRPYHLRPTISPEPRVRQVRRLYTTKIYT
ncbi:hypothetical protein SCHPADRAFT_742522 [Schizopora paradoxa]|uniref:Uncharacterized protein n=1 Tax=Schizopora paradoxa TaxID=27342 RepID=A0A0H2R0Z2_9AGAM|nr:hypothetical protein SCHPADRAFT_742522 [Schizopora paradoxa]